VTTPGGGAPTTTPSWPQRPPFLAPGQWTPGRQRYDLVNDGLVPLCLVGMLWCLASYVFDVRSVLVHGDTPVLRYVLFWFLIAVVGIAKIEALRGGSAIALPYKVGLAVATGLFVLRLSAFDALFAAGGGAGIALLLHGLLFGAIYWGGTAITRDCTVTEETEELAEASLMGNSIPEPGAPTPGLAQRVRPGRSVFRFSVFALAVFGAGQLVLARGEVAVYRSAFLSVVGYVFCALLVLALTSLSGLRLYLLGRRLKPPVTMTAAWLSSALAVVLVVMSAALLVPRRDLRGEDTVMARGIRVTGESRALDRAPVSGVQPGGDDSRVSAGQDADAQHGAPGREPGGSRGQAERSGQPGRDEGRGPGGQAGETGGGDRATSGGGDDAGSGQGGKGQGEGDGQGAGSAEAGGQPEPPPPPEPPVPEGVSTALFWILAALALLALAWGIIRSREGLLGFVRAVLAFPVRLLAALAELLSRLGLRRPVPAGTGGSSAAARRIPEYRNPFTGRGRTGEMTPRELIIYSYGALMALAERLGTPRREDQTALEFAHNLPPRMETIRDEVRDLSRMYVEAEYAPASDLSGHVDRLRQIWVRMDVMASG